MIEPGLVPWDAFAVVPTEDATGAPRSGAQLADAAAALPSDQPFRFGGAPLEPDVAAEVFRRLAASPRPFAALVRVAAIERKSVLEDAARAGCLALEVRREGPLLAALASGLGADRRAYDRAVTALRRARGLGIATVARIDLGRPGDDEGAFERTLRFCRRALIAIPLVEASPPGLELDAVVRATPSLAARLLGAMDAATLENGLRWTAARLNRHRAIWRRALWPAGTRLPALRVGYAVRRAAGRSSTGRYTATMHLLRLLNRTKRSRPRGRLLSTLAEEAAPAEPRRVLRVRATANERLAALFIAVEGALDTRGARSLLDQVREALQAGFQRITIDFAGLEWVSSDVVTRFLAENQARLVELARWTRLENLHGVASALRRQLGDVEEIRLIEVAASQG